MRSASCSVRNWWRSSSAANSSSASGLTRPSSGERALGGAQPLLLLLADVRDRGGRPGSSRSARRRAGSRRDVLVRAVLLDQHRRVEAEVVDRARLQRLDAQALLGAGDLVAVGDVGELGELGGADVRPRRGRRSPRGRASRARPSRRRRARPTRGAATRRARPARAVAPSRDGLGDRGLARPGALALGGPARGRPARPGRRVRATRPGRTARARAPRRCAGQPRLGLARAGAGRELGQPVARALSTIAASLSAGSASAAAQALGELGELGGRRPRACRDAAERLLQPLGLGVRGAGRGAEVAQLLGHGGERGVGLVEPVEGALGARARRQRRVGARELERTRSASAVASAARCAAWSSAACRCSSARRVAEPPRRGAGTARRRRG